MDIYQEHILDLYKHPLNKGKLDDAQVHQHEMNSSCGDNFTFHLLFEKNKLKDVKFEGIGCAISVASASLLTEKVKGMNIQKIAQLTKEDVLEWLGIKLSPSRLKCALLPLQALSRGIITFTQHHQKDSPNPQQSHIAPPRDE
jgi:nitrogen fixation NifU-like protein